MFEVKNQSLLTQVAPKDFLVTPGRIAPERGGVAISGSGGTWHTQFYYNLICINLTMSTYLLMSVANHKMFLFKIFTKKVISSYTTSVSMVTVMTIIISLTSILIYPMHKNVHCTNFSQL